MPGTKALQARKVVTRLDSTTLFHSSSWKSTSALRLLMPAELIRICGLANFAFTSLPRRATSLSLVMSAVKVSTLPFRVPATLSSFALLRPTSAMLAPAPEIICAIASPKPPLPPTITAVLPVRSIFMSRNFLWRKNSALGVGFQEEPARAGNNGGGGHSVHHHRPVVVGLLQDLTEHHRRHEAGKVAQHVHGRRHGRGVLLADLDAGD